MLIVYLEKNLSNCMRKEIKILKIYLTSQPDPSIIVYNITCRKLSILIKTYQKFSRTEGDLTYEEITVCNHKRFICNIY